MARYEEAGTFKYPQWKSSVKQTYWKLLSILDSIAHYFFFCAITPVIMLCVCDLNNYVEGQFSVLGLSLWPALLILACPPFHHSKDARSCLYQQGHFLQKSQFQEFYSLKSIQLFEYYLISLPLISTETQDFSLNEVLHGFIYPYLTKSLCSMIVTCLLHTTSTT